MSDIASLAASMPFVDEVYAKFLESPNNVDPEWRRLFEAPPDLIVAPTGVGTRPSGPIATADAAKLLKVFTLVRSYRVRGHLEASLDPLEPEARPRYPELDPKTYGFTEKDLEELIVPARTIYGLGDAPLGTVLARLRQTYCRTIGVEFMHIQVPARRAWLEERMEASLNKSELDRDTQLYILDRLVAADALEQFVHTKYPGTKRFGIEGGETLVPLLALTLERVARQGVAEVVLGMAHRGRLNVLANTLHENASRLFEDFEDTNPESVLGGGDVKYHQGHSADVRTRTGDRIHLTLTANPSHLEAVNPVVLGRVRAKQRRSNDHAHEKFMGLLIHGDSAFAGQGLVPETFNMAQVEGYQTGGTFHVIVNNQIGFTTTSALARSTEYPTDVAKAIQAPIFHVNGDDPEAVAHVVALALDYRREFKTDVVVDMFCFRRHGHNELDEPSFTQPLLYKKIVDHPTVYRIYADQLIQRGATTPEEVQQLVDARVKQLELDLVKARSVVQKTVTKAFQRHWVGFEGGPEPLPDAETGVARDKLALISDRITSIPRGFNAHPKIIRLFEARAQMGRGEKPLDWSMAELLSFATILVDGNVVRLSGQDSRRGTFSQRHSVIVDITTGAEHYPLNHVAPDQAQFRVYDSPLSEAAVLGFEFGYSLDLPEALVIWEAQFGDFANGAQVVIDQFLSSCEDKWKRVSGLALFLPHGYEGQGPEHSNARPERFLQLAAEDNLQVIYPSTPAQNFHMLRRQVVRRWRKPLIVMTPKSLLRDPRASSPIEDLTRGSFKVILDDPAPPPRDKVTRVMLCSGKVYYDLADERLKRDDRRTALVRVEQLYPWRATEVQKAIDSWPNAKDVVWVQEEPSNMGFWSFVEPRLRRITGARTLSCVSRPESASPATGSAKAHAIEQRILMDRAFAGGN